MTDSFLPLAWYCGSLLLEQVTNSDCGCEWENIVNRCEYLSGLREGLHFYQFSGRPSAVQPFFGHILTLVEDLCRFIMPLFLQQNSPSLYAVICLQVYSPQLQKRAVVLHNTAHIYNSSPNRNVFLCVCVCVGFFRGITQKKKAHLLHIISIVQRRAVTNLQGISILFCLTTFQILCFLFHYINFTASYDSE